MPYIITTSNPRRVAMSARLTHNSGIPRVGSANIGPAATRTAVATLDEARTVVREVLSAHRLDLEDAPAALSAIHAQADGIFAHDGTGQGTIGPLPDGTMIEVRYESELPTGPRKFYCGECEVIHRDSTDCRA